MAYYKVFRNCPSCGASEPYDHTNPMNKCWDCKSVYCVACSTSTKGFGQCPSCGSATIMDPVDVVHMLCGPEWWGWSQEGRCWKTGAGWNESEYEKMD